MKTDVRSSLLYQFEYAETEGLSQYQQIGNAVPVLLAKAIGECVSYLLDKTLN